VYNGNVRFEWDEQKAAGVQVERGITLDDVVDAFANPNAAEQYDEARSIKEDRYLIIGLSGIGLLTIVYTVWQDGQEDVYQIIMAWHATTREERIYEGK
jgi:uncharacterized DUF497 family protein